MSSLRHDCVLNFMLVGDSYAGKSSLLMRLIKQRFDSKFMNCGPNTGTKFISIPEEGKIVKLICWDVPGTDRHLPLMVTCSRGVTGVLLVYDVMSRDSFHDARKWLANVRKHVDPNFTCMLVANKVDLCTVKGLLRVVSREEGEQLAREEGLLFIEASAKTGKNVDRAFEEATREILSKMNRGLLDNNRDWVLIDTLSNQRNVENPTWTTLKVLSDPITNLFSYYGAKGSGSPGTTSINSGFAGSLSPVPKTTMSSFIPRIFSTAKSLPPVNIKDNGPIAVDTPNSTSLVVPVDLKNVSWQQCEQVEVTSQMSLQDMFDCLLDHGCLDFSSKIDPSVQFRTPIAGGAFGDVYRGSLRDGTAVAIKALRYYLLSEDTAPKSLKRAMRELYYWSKLKHYNVQELLGVIMLEGRLGVVSLWMPNGHLEEYLRKSPDANRRELSIQVASGVEYLHSVDMVHGDLKARNVLVDQNGVARISDFDHSILSNCTLAFTETTNVGGGTVRWMAPELFLTKDEAGADAGARTKETDVYALGMTILEIITGEHPYAEYRADRGIILALAQGKYPVRPKRLESDRIWGLLRHCWDHNRAARALVSVVFKELSTFGPKDFRISTEE